MIPLSDAFPYVRITKHNNIYRLQMRFTGEELPAYKNPCVPSPCGLNAQCSVANNSSSCSCLPEFIGTPPNCRPECMSNPECSEHLSCINNKCKDPCVGVCGLNAECKVVSHTPNCICQANYYGDPFTRCTMSKFNEFNLIYSISINIIFSRNNSFHE